MSCTIWPSGPNDLAPIGTSWNENDRTEIPSQGQDVPRMKRLDRSISPLTDVRVIELASFLAAPMLSMFLADFGADVIKVERPGSGDEIRMWGYEKNGVGLFSKVINRNKRSVTADLRTPLGVDIIKRLAQSTDVVIENFRPGTLERWGLGYDTLSAANPGLILIRISGFGQTGPYRTRPGFGTLAEAFAGYSQITGEPDGPPLLPGFGLADSITGIAGAYLTMIALRARERLGGAGQVVDLAIYEPLFTLLGSHVVDYDQLGIIQQRDGSRLPFTAPRNVFQTADNEWVVIAGSAQSTFRRICMALGCTELLDDPRFDDNRTRLKHVNELDAALEMAIGSLTLTEVLDRCRELDATVGAVYDIAKIFADPHYAARENVISVPDPELGLVRMQGALGKLSRTPGEIEWAGPSVGQHNREILVQELGFDERKLRAAGLEI